MSNSADKSSISPSLWTHIAFVFDAACEKVHGGDPMAHNDAGNLCSDDNSYSYHYDYENRLTQITKPDGPDEGSDPDPVASYTYDALGRRIEFVDNISNVTTRFYYDGWRVLSETDDSDEVQREFIYGNYLDEVLVKVESSQDIYYTHDHLYSPVALLDSSGSVVERYEYDAYGKCNIFDDSYNTRSSSSHNNSRLFTGQMLDTLDSGDLLIMYYKHRYYLVDLGRFNQPDPIRYVGGMNLYKYVLSNPVTFVDKYGLISDGYVPYPKDYPHHCDNGNPVVNWLIDTFYSIPIIGDMFLPWLSGRHCGSMCFDEDSYQVDDMKSSPGVANALQAYCLNNNKDIFSCEKTKILEPYSDGMKFAPWRPDGPIRAGLNGTRQFVGSYNIEINPIDEDTVQIVISNTTSLSSATYRLWPASWNYCHQLGPGIYVPMSNMTQTYAWTQDINCDDYLPSLEPLYCGDQEPYVELTPDPTDIVWR